MDKLRKVGLSALAGSLAMFSASADITVGGSGEFTYANSGGTTDDTGNPFGLSHVISFTGTGEMDNGWSYSVFSATVGQDLATDSNSLSITMGDLGTFSFDQGVGIAGITTLKNEVPTAYEEAGHGVSGSGNSLDGAGNTSALGYASPSFGGLSLSLQYHPSVSSASAQAGGVSGAGENSSNVNYAITYAPTLIDGLTLAYGSSKTEDMSTAAANDDEEMTLAVNYVNGGLSVGYQMTEAQTGGAGENGNNVEEFGIAFAVNENLSVSFNQADNEDDAPSSTNVTEDSTNINAAYTMGSASFRIAVSEADNVNGVTGITDENMELSVKLSF
jgi:outer membrane protein OmpU